MSSLGTYLCLLCLICVFLGIAGVNDKPGSELEITWVDSLMGMGSDSQVSSQEEDNTSALFDLAWLESDVVDGDSAYSGFEPADKQEAVLANTSPLFSDWLD
eukprot:Selendium_serpulae@DN6163_c0_g1_i1.p2